MKFNEWFERYRAEQGQIPSHKITWEASQKEAEIKLAHRDIEIERLKEEIEMLYQDMAGASI